MKKLKAAFALPLLAVLAGCVIGTGYIDTTVDVTIFPEDNPWNTDVSSYAVHQDSAAFIASIGAERGLHADFGTEWEGAPIGIPFVVVGAGQPRVKVTFDYADESDPGPYPIPNNAPIEGGEASDGDRHVIVIDRSGLKLYELYAAYRTAGGWTAGSGAVWDLTRNEVRPAGWTSADAAGLPIFPGLVRFDEADSGEIRHALRFTVQHTQRGYISPASHFASDSSDPGLPPMGLRLRLRKDYPLSGFSERNKAILRALKTYGMIVADNGSDWFISGAPDGRWDDEDLHELARVTGGDFEVVYTGEIQH